MKIEILHLVGCESVSTLQILKLEVVTVHLKDHICKTDGVGPTHGPFPTGFASEDQGFTFLHPST